MLAAKPGDRVKVHYTGRLEDGSVFDSSVNREPLEFTIIVTVAQITPDNVTLDANHPLAGQNLVFDIELVEIAA